jgi:penicillin-binding protein 2
MKYSIRSLLIFSFFILFLFFILIYIAILQIHFFSYYKEKSIANYTRFEKIEGLRGIITDCNNIPIAITKPIFKLIWKKHPKKLNDLDKELLKFLEEIYHKKIDSEELSKNNDKIIIHDNASFEELSLFLENFPNSQRITIEHILQRHYPHKELFCHAIGYINKEKNGLLGLEKLYNDVLIGKKGLIENKVNAKGEILNNNFLILPEEGGIVKTTLDYHLQKIIFDCFPKNESGCVIIVDPISGAVKSIFSSPTFDPHIFQNRIDNTVWQNLQDNKILINRGFQALYPPGSIYKLIIGLTLLEEKIITNNTKWFCAGFLEYKGRKYHCNNKQGHGLISINEAISHSCNIPFYLESINNLSIETIYKYATSFGLGKKTGIALSEKEGLIPNKLWKKKKYGEKWYTGETLSIAIGQGATTVTPIQITQIIMGIMHGYIIPPYILAQDKKEKIYLPYKKENLQIIKDNMKISSKKGTSKALASLTDWEIYGKTGTVQVCSLDKLNAENNENQVIEKKTNHHGFFACWAKYKNERPMIIVFIIENNGSSRYTVEIIKNFFTQCQDHYRS